jgi:hypothetical protein
MNTPRALLLACTLVPAPAFAQVVPPPPKAPEKTPEYVPPQPTEQARPIAPQRRAAPPRPGQQGQFINNQTIPDVPFETLIKLDAEGKIIPIGMPAEYAAVKNNPMAGDYTQAVMAHYIHERTGIVEELVIENLDLILEIDGGFFERINYNERANLREVNSRIRPLIPATPFSQDAQAKGHFTRMQAGMNTRVAQEYDKAVIAQASRNRDPNDPNAIGRQMDAILRQSITESTYAYENLLVALADHHAGAKAKATLSAEEESAFATYTQSVQNAEDRAARISAGKALMAAISVESARALLGAARAERPEPTLPEIPEFQRSGVSVFNTPEEIAAERARLAANAELAQREVAEGIRPFVNPTDGKTYFKNPDGTDRLATEEEIAAYRAKIEKQNLEEKARKDAEFKAALEAAKKAQEGEQAKEADPK